MVSQNNRRTRAVRSTHAARRLTVRHGAPRPLAPARSRRDASESADLAAPSTVDAAPESAAVAIPDASASPDSTSTHTATDCGATTDGESTLKPERATESGASDSKTSDESSHRWRIAAWALVVLLLGALMAAGLFGRQWYDQRQLTAARQQALAAARQETVDFVSISAVSVDRDLQRIADHATGQFKDEFTQDMAQVRAAVVENKVDSQGTALRAAIVSYSRSTAVVLVAVDATVKNTSAADGRLSHYRIQVTLARQSGRWLISQLTFVG